MSSESGGEACFAVLKDCFTWKQCSLKERSPPHVPQKLSAKGSLIHHLHRLCTDGVRQTQEGWPNSSASCTSDNTIHVQQLQALPTSKEQARASLKTSALFRVRREETSENAVYSWILPGLEQWEWWGDVTAGTGGVHLRKHESPALTPIRLHLSQSIPLQFHSPCF